MQNQAARWASQRDGIRKRPRKIWSCLECRRKKLQCDHGLPACGRCTRAGAAASCVYASAGPSTSKASVAHAPVGSTSAASVARRPAQLSQASGRTFDADLLARLEGLEEKLCRYESLPNSQTGLPHTSQLDGQLPSPEGTADGADRPTPHSAEPSSHLLRGSAFRTKFSGDTCASTLAEHIQGITGFKRDAHTTFPAFDQIQQYLNKSEHRTTLTVFEKPPNTEHDLKALLPSRPETDRLVRIYLDSFDYIFPVLHVPTFQQDYEQLWSGESETDARFVAIVLLVVAIALSLTSTPFNLTNTTGPTPRSQATSILDACQQWLHMRVYQYESILDFQVNFLLLLGRQINGKRNKRTWANAGGVLRTFMCTGLHRDPEDLGSETSSLDKEMRRRIWASTVEFELQAAFEHGMPPGPWTQQCDIDPPSNVHDSDVIEVCPVETYTKSSFVVASWKTIQLRHQLIGALNDVDNIMPFSRASSYTETFKHFLQGLPKWIGTSSEAVRALIAINIHQCIVAMHAQQLRHASSAMEKQLSRMVLVESATQMIDCHKAALDGDSNLVELFYDDHVRAALSICYAYTTAYPLGDRFLISAIEQNGYRALELAISMYGEKVMRFGGSKLNLWLICAVDGLMKTTADPKGRMSYIQKAVDHFTRPFYRLMALTRDPLVPPASEHGDQPPAVIPLRPDDPFGTSKDLSNIEDIAMPGFGELAEWTFDDFSFDPNDFLDLQT